MTIRTQNPSISEVYLTLEISLNNSKERTGNSGSFFFFYSICPACLPADRQVDWQGRQTPAFPSFAILLGSYRALRRVAAIDIILVVRPICADSVLVFYAARGFLVDIARVFCGGYALPCAAS